MTEAMKKLLKIAKKSRSVGGSSPSLMTFDIDVKNDLSVSSYSQISKVHEKSNDKIKSDPVNLFTKNYRYGEVITESRPNKPK